MCDKESDSRMLPEVEFEEPMDLAQTGLATDPDIRQEQAQTPSRDRNTASASDVQLGLVTTPHHYHPSHAHQISPSQYAEESVSYTQHAVRELKASPEFKKHTQKCHRQV